MTCRLEFIHPSPRQASWTFKEAISLQPSTCQGKKWHNERITTCSSLPRAVNEWITKHFARVWWLSWLMSCSKIGSWATNFICLLQSDTLWIYLASALKVGDFPPEVYLVRLLHFPHFSPVSNSVVQPLFSNSKQWTGNSKGYLSVKFVHGRI